MRTRADSRLAQLQIAKPYNSVLFVPTIPKSTIGITLTLVTDSGEHFHAHWDVEPLSLTLSHGAPDPQEWLDTHPTPEVLSNAGRSYHHHPPTFIANPSSSSSLPTRDSLGVSSATSSSGTPSLETTATSAGIGEEDKTRTVFLNEQISHHPPISFFRLEARGPKGTVVATGADQIAARVSRFPIPLGKSSRSLTPSSPPLVYWNKSAPFRPLLRGDALTFTPPSHQSLPRRKQQGNLRNTSRSRGRVPGMPPSHAYERSSPGSTDRLARSQITHPTANVAGLLRGSPYATICEHSYITCRKSTGGTKRLRCIMAYQEEVRSLLFSFCSPHRELMMSSRA